MLNGPLTQDDELTERMRKLFGTVPRRLQVAALPWRRAEGDIEVMLITSRDTGRWVLPKGWPEAREPLCEAAARGGRPVWRDLAHRSRPLSLRQGAFLGKGSALRGAGFSVAGPRRRRQVEGAAPARAQMDAAWRGRRHGQRAGSRPDHRLFRHQSREIRGLRQFQEKCGAVSLRIA